MKQYRIYILVDDGRRIGLAVVFEGTYSECSAYKKARPAAGQFVSALGFEAAYKRHC